MRTDTFWPHHHHQPRGRGTIAATPRTEWVSDYRICHSIALLIQWLSEQAWRSPCADWPNNVAAVTRISRAACRKCTDARRAALSGEGNQGWLDSAMRITPISVHIQRRRGSILHDWRHPALPSADDDTCRRISAIRKGDVQFECSTIRQPEAAGPQTRAR